MAHSSTLPRSSWAEIAPPSYHDVMHWVSSYWPITIAECADDPKATPKKILDWILSSSEALQLLLLVFVMMITAYMLFHPNFAMRRLLRKYIGMEFGDFRASLPGLSLIFTDIQLSPVESPILRDLFAILFPSAIVQRYEESDKYPASKISIEELKVCLRMRSLAAPISDDGDGRNASRINAVSRWTKRVLYIMFQRPIISVELDGVILEVEKAYIAPQPPPEFRVKSHHALPSAVTSAMLGPDIPVFDQDYILDFLRGDELNDANRVTLWIQQWIQHTEKNMKNFGANTNAAKERTDDEKKNTRMHSIPRKVFHSILRIVFHFISIQLIDASIIISGAGSKTVKEALEQPRDTNSILAKLSKQHRALTMIGTDLITISVSPGEQYNLLLSLDGLHIKVGNPVSATMDEYAWHTVVHPFDVVIELTGILHLISWKVCYDHLWANRTLGLKLSSTEIAVSLSPDHLHTLLLHLDDYTNPASPFNEWFEWLKKAHFQTLSTSEDEKAAYCNNYARINGATIKEVNKLDSVNHLTPSQMKDLESRMTRSEIMSRRCFAMKTVWGIPDANGELDEFLRNSSSLISGRNVESRSTSMDVPTSFQLIYPTRLHVLTGLARTRDAFLAPTITIEFFTKALVYDFTHGPFVVGSEEGSTQRAVPSSLALSDLSFKLKHTDPLFPTNPDANLTAPRHLLSMSIQACGMVWDALDTESVGEFGLPTFPDGSAVGIMYKRRQKPSSSKVLSVDVKIAVAPTKKQDPLIVVDLQSSDLVIILNPLPLLSAMDTLIELSVLPFETSEEANTVVIDEKTEESRAVVSTNINASVENTAILLMTDRKEILRGILGLETNKLTVKYQSSGLSGHAAISTMPIVLHAGQIVHYPTSSDNDCIEWRTMPFKPIMKIEGGRIIVSGMEKPTESRGTSSIEIKIDIGTDLFLVNVSPSTLVALIGFTSSLDPCLDWARGNEEDKERIRLVEKMKLEEEQTRLQYRREALFAIFDSIDIDRTGIMQKEELERIFLILFAEGTSSKSFHHFAPQIANGSQIIKSQMITAPELARECDYLISILDSGHTNQIFLKELHSVLYRISNDIDDNNFSPKIATGIDYLDKVAQSTSFLSAPMMRKLIYFGDLREYAAVHEVHRIAGHAMLKHGCDFPSPSLWHKGEGIEIFWHLYESETGCTRNSLNGQNVYSVQHKLVRSLCNYQFAKFCWKTLVRPQLIAACTQIDALTGWILDNDPQCRVNVGAIDRLLDQISKDSTEAQQKGHKKRDTHYNVSLILAVDSAILRFGSSHTFTNPLFEAKFSQVSINAFALLSSQTGWFVQAKKGEDTVQMDQPASNEIRFQTTFSLVYLNTKHNHMECFIQTYSSYGCVAYQTYLLDSTFHDDHETASFAVNINCPRSLNINASSAFFQTASMLANIGSQLDPDAYQEMILSRDIQVKNCIGRDLGIFEGCTHGGIQNIDAENTAAISLDNLDSRLSFSIERYKLIQGITVSPYQSLMVPLDRNRKNPGVRRRRKQLNTSGFSHLTVVPVAKSDSLDSITLAVRTCVTIQTEIPIRVKIVRLRKELGYLRKRSSTKYTQIDLTKKRLADAIKRLVEDGLDVYEKDCVEEGVEVPLPLNLLDSSYYHALHIQDLNDQNNGSWRQPILLSKDFLFNPTEIREVARCHALSGVVIQKERLNICFPNKHRNADAASDATKSILRRTAWDTTIKIVPFFLLSNSMPFPLLARMWQLPIKEDDAVWRDPSFSKKQAAKNEGSIGDEDTSITPSIKGRGANPDQFRQPTGTWRNGYFSTYSVERGETLRLSGINCQQSLFIQVSQRLQVSDANGTDVMWSRPLQVNVEKLRTGVNQKGSFALSKLPLDLGDNCHCLIDASIEMGTRMPLCTIYSPYWIMNKTGTKLEYKIKSSGQPKHFVDSGNGGLPIMMHCGKSDGELSVIPLECPTQAVAMNWWDASCNGRLVLLKRNTIKDSVEWSEKIELDTAGTSGEIRCGKHLYSCHIESLAGAFFRTNLITISPRYIVKNMLHMPINILPIRGSLNDATKKTRQLRQSLSEDDERVVLCLGKLESTILYNFAEVSSRRGIDKTYRWVAFSVNAHRQGGGFNGKWHLIPADIIGSTLCGEHDGFNETMCGIVEGKVHGSAEKVVSITHAAVPPFRIENRSNNCCLQFVQDDDDGIVFELPPMHSCGYTWDSPLGKKRLQAVVIKAQSRGHPIEEIDQNQHHEVVSFDDSPDRSVDSDENGDDFFHNEAAVELCLRSRSNRSVSSTSASTGTRSTLASSSMSRFPTKKMHVFDTKARSYTMSKIGRQKSLPYDSSSLSVHLRISAGTKILSFNDSPWLTEQAEFGLLRNGGFSLSPSAKTHNFKSALCDINIDGLSFYLMDDFPRELMGIIIRNVQIYKPMGSIEASAKVRHFQVDAMLPGARYPIIAQPKLIGVDRHGCIKNKTLNETVEEIDCFWLKGNEVDEIYCFEVTFSYVPQRNMMWVPSIDVFICPMKIQLDLIFVLQVVSVFSRSISKYQEGAATNISTTTHANDQIQYITYGQLTSRMTYIERLHISPLWFEVEINIKPDELDRSESETAGEASLTLNSIARSTNSAAVAGILSWVINVVANFAHVSPTFRYAAVIDKDRYCDILELARDISISYIVQSIKQSYKVVFSMQLLGDPSLFAFQMRKGISDLVLRTRDEVVAGGKDGFGKGVASFSGNFVGGGFVALSKSTGGIAKTLDSIIYSELTSIHLKPKLSTDTKKRPHHAIEGFAQGSIFLGKSFIHGIAGLIGNPYRGAKTGTSLATSMTGVAKGVVTGVAGFVVAPVIGTLGFMAKTTDGIGATAKYQELGEIEARCRPVRLVSWGRPMCDHGLSYLKAIGIRVHTVRYQNIRKRIIQKEDPDHNGDNDDKVTSKEHKKIRAAEERRKHPPRKVVNILYNKENRQYVTSSTRPQLLSGRPGKLTLSQDHYAVCFEENIILESYDLQLSDEVVVQFGNSKITKSALKRSKLSGECKLTVGDIYAYVLRFYREQIRGIESKLSEETNNNSSRTPSQAASASEAYTESLIIPAPQEYSLFRPPKAKSQLVAGDIFETIGEEMKSIRESEALDVLDSDSVHSESELSFLLHNGNKKAKDKGKTNIAKVNEKLFGSISLSFFPVLWE